MTTKNQIDPTLQNIIQESAEEHNITFEEARDIFFDVFKKTKKSVQHPDLPKVMLHRFGSFEPSLRKVNSRIYSYLDQMRDGNCTEEEFNIMFPLLWKARRRLRKELGLGQKNMN